MAHILGELRELECQPSASYRIRLQRIKIEFRVLRLLSAQPSSCQHRYHQPRQRMDHESKLGPLHTRSLLSASHPPKKGPATWVSPLSRFRDSLPPRHRRAARRRALGITASE